MAQDKWDMQLVKTIWVVFWIIFVFYVVSTRTPNYFADQKTEGTVVSVAQQHYGSGRRTDTDHHLVVSFLADTTEYQFVDPDGSFFNSYSKGDKVTVVYNDDDPNNAALPGTFGYWIKVSEFFIALLIVTVITAFVTVVPHGYDPTYTKAIKK